MSTQEPIKGCEFNPKNLPNEKIGTCQNSDHYEQSSIVNNKYRVICIIPARGGSKEVKNKNLKLLNGKPLIAYAIESAVKSKLFEYVFVSTDSKKIADVAKKYDAYIPFRRPDELSTDSATLDDVLIHAVKTLSEQGYWFDVVCLRDCTVPFISKNDMQKAISLLDNTCDSVFTVTCCHPNSYFGMFEVNQKGFLEPSKLSNHEIKRRQDAPIVYSLNGFYVHHADKLLIDKKMFTDKIRYSEIPKSHGIMIDDEFDFFVAEMFAKHKQQKERNEN